MASYWPSSYAIENNPVVAERMNHLPKIVFSRTLDKASWNNLTLVKDDPASEVSKIKKEVGNDMAIPGSGSIVSQFPQESLLDEYPLVVNPVILGKGRTIFGVKETLTMKPVRTRTFSSGSVLLCYEPRLDT